MLMFGNPLYEDFDDAEMARLQVIMRVPQLTKLDGKLITPVERDKASKQKKI